MTNRLLKWSSSGLPWIWISAACVATSLLMVVGIIALLAFRGVGHFWPADVVQANYSVESDAGDVLLEEVVGELIDTETVSAQQVTATGIRLNPGADVVQRQLLKLGNRDITGTDFAWLISDFLIDIRYPVDVVTLERTEWGNFYGFLTTVSESGQRVADRDSVEFNQLWQEFSTRLSLVRDIQDQIDEIETRQLADINYRMQSLLREGKNSLGASGDTAGDLATLSSMRNVLDSEYEILRLRLLSLEAQAAQYSAEFMAANGDAVTIAMIDIVRAYLPNKLTLAGKLDVFFSRIAEFLTAQPREANTEGGVYPAIFGTVMMVLLMSVIVTPLGVIAAVYLREYARQGFFTQLVRVAVNNLAGVPSIVYGVFGLGFFVYFVGAEIDQGFYSENLPSPTFGTPGLLWASLTLALLTVPVVIVATEEGLARIPASVREGSLALGATKFETLWRVVLPMASPAMMTGLILAVARAAGEVAPLMLVGVVKLAPSLPVDRYYPYLHLDQKFMHLGFHIYDVAFQSPNIEAATPLVFATAFLLVTVIATLNIGAVALRNHLREKYKSLDV
ncbi:MAG: phosphate transport system permease protein [Pseudohongiellaceae bacterium]|jgi:phosphate transport system permease protein